ncbi:Tim44-like domain-containing protein [Clostridium sp. DSM 100503]|uniref:Tim44 domain-containing protein n=1 Tax=Clostridium sp. DSM 100503 TaxID=2963282 RepID=UPI002149AD8C|nr:Tim44-like domain-containing protein [Clostridium sp. DSM 100503]MCR1950793.1 Tim44-like domain-containing protein [Clostridium sp. DSM 100503]
MKKFKVSNFLKRFSAIIMVILVVNGPLVAYARAGGGGGGGSHSSSHGGSPSGSYRGRSNPITSIINLGMFAIVGSAGTIVLKVRLSKKKAKSISAIKNLSKNDYNWDYNSIKNDIEEAFYKVQVAWMERNQDLAKEYMSEKLYIRHKSKTEWMKVRKEKNILEKMKLISAIPIALQDQDGTNEDSLWVHIKAKSIDYTIKEETNEVIEGNKYRRTHFEEYWKFIKNEKRWILDEIRQIDDINDLDFFDINIKNKKSK